MLTYLSLKDMTIIEVIKADKTRTKKIKPKEASSTQKAFASTECIWTIEQPPRCNRGSPTKLKNKNIRGTGKSSVAQLERQELDE